MQQPKSHNKSAEKSQGGKGETLPEQTPTLTNMSDVLLASRKMVESNDTQGRLLQEEIVLITKQTLLLQKERLPSNQERTLS